MSGSPGEEAEQAGGAGFGPSAGPAAGPATGPVPTDPLGLWEGYGIEIEMMIVDAETLDVRPVADRLFELRGWTPPSGGQSGAEHETGASYAPSSDAASDLVVEGVGWSNEVALHVLELKTPGPVSRLDGVARAFQQSVDRANASLEELGCRLLPGGMHPWMDPAAEFRIWPHEYTEVYHTFDRIFGCRGHGWSNLQSTHVNLPFSDEREFGLLHEAVRLVLPLIPALAASSPVVDGRIGPALDSRMVAYRGHARQVPSVTGAIVPESVRNEAEYRARVMEPIYHDLASVDRDGILHHEWVNARGAIARFTRSSVEIRVMDAQESPRMDLAVVTAIVAAVREAAEVLEAGAVSESPPETPETEELAVVLDRTVHAGSRAALDPGIRDVYRRMLDLSGTPESVGEIWEGFLEGRDGWSDSLGVILREGTLAERILADLGVEWPGSPGDEIPRSRLRDTYRRLAHTLSEGGTFRS